MSTDDPEQPTASASDESQRPRWDPVELMRRRAAQARATRDESIAELRESMTDDEARDLFGIDLGEIEK